LHALGVQRVVGKALRRALEPPPLLRQKALEESQMKMAR